MHKRTGMILALPLGLSVLLLYLLVSTLQTAVANPAAALDRPQDPAVSSGDTFPAFLGAPLGELVLYRYETNSWAPIPFQLDEVTASGNYTTTEDGLLDANDELVFMGADGGEQAPADDWPADAAARQNQRYAIEVTDPLDPAGQSWAYLFRSPTLPRATAEYVAWDAATQTLSGISYTLQITNDSFVGISALTLNGNDVNVLDRQKTRAQVTVLFFGNPLTTTTFTEEDITELITEPIAIELPIVGPVRAVGGSNTQGFAFYGARADLSLALPLADVEIAPFTVAHVDYVRVSLDLRDPAVSGMVPTSYYDSNGSTVSVDGNPDAVPAMPLLDWYQIDGAYGGWVSVAAIDPANGQATNYYLDDDTFNPEDTGDGLSFGDTGARIDDPNGLVTLEQVLYVTPAGAGNVGATAQSWANNPLQVVATAESFGTLSHFLPVILRHE